MIQGNALIWLQCPLFFNHVRMGTSKIKLLISCQMAELESIPGHLWIQLPILHPNLWWRPKFHPREHQTYSGQSSNQRRSCSPAFSTGHRFSKSEHYAVWFINPWWCHELLDHVVLKPCPLRWTQRGSTTSNGASYNSSPRSRQDVDKQVWVWHCKQLERGRYGLSQRHWWVLPRDPCRLPNPGHIRFPRFCLYQQHQEYPGSNQVLAVCHAKYRTRAGYQLLPSCNPSPLLPTLLCRFWIFILFGTHFNDITLYIKESFFLL